MICDSGVQKIATVPNSILDILKREIESWDYINDSEKFDAVFGKHKAKIYHTGKITTNIHYQDSILPVIRWVENLAGPNQSVVRCFLNLMSPGQSFKIHVDTLNVHLVARRFHIPIMAGEDCTYYTYKLGQTGTWKEFSHKMEHGYLYELDNVNPHNVENKTGFRINFIADVIPNDKISDSLTSANLEQMKFLAKIFTQGLDVVR